MNEKTRVIVGLGLLTAVVIVLQALGASIRFGLFSITVVLVPIIVGAAIYGLKAGAWLGFVFSVVVLITDSAAFMAVSIPGTIITVIAKGTLAGLAAGAVYMALSKKNQILAVIAAGIVAPVVNTGIFVIGCYVFFLDTLTEWAAGAGFSNATAFIFMGLVGVNFIVEFLVNMVLATAVVQIVQIGKRQLAVAN